MDFIRRHVIGDYGICCKEDCEANDLALSDGDRIFSVYMSNTGERLYVITEYDRSATTVLLPEEY